MRLLSLQLRSFGCIEQAHLELGPGLNVLYGPNDLGKSTLAHAVRAVLLLPARNSEAAVFTPWHRDAIPEVTLTFAAREDPRSELPPRVWRVRKAFGGGRRAQADLEWSNDGEQFALDQKGAGVDGKLRQMLGWGVPEARARGPRGFPTSFLATVLLGPQATPGSVLGHGLGDDPSESGREQLTEALQALAQDPQFKDVLEQAQRKVDEAFTPTGKPRTGKRSPMSSVRERIESLSAELRLLQTRVHDSDDVRQRLLALEAAQAEAVLSRDEAQQTWRQAKANWDLGQQRHAAQAGIDRARTALEQGRQVLAERRRWQEAAQRHLEGRPAAEAAQSRATEAEQRTTSALAAAEAAASAIEQGGDAQSRLARQALETRRLELASKYAEAHAQLLHAEKVQAMATEVETLQQRREALEQDRRAAERSTNEAEAARREAEAERRLYESALDLRRWQQARARVQRAETSEAEAERLLAKAQDSTTRAQAVDNRLAATALPAAETVEQWRALAEERRVMRARLEVGLSLVVQRDDARTIAAGADDAEPRSVEAGATVDAQRTIAVRIGDEIELAIVGGDARSRAAHQAVEQRWADEVAPALERLDAADLAGLRQRIEQADDERHQAERWRAEATAMRREAEIHSERAAELPALRSTMDANAKALASVDRQALEERTADYDETTLDQRRTSAEARGQEAQHRHAQARARTQSLASELQVRASEHDRLAAALTEATAKLPGDPVSVAEAAFDRRSAIEGEQETVSEQVAALDEAQARLRAEADAAVVEARTEVDRARVAAAAATAALDERREKLAQAEGRLAQLEAQARDIDESALEQALTERVEALDSIAEPTVVVTAEALEQAETERNGRQQRVREVGAELDQQRGALKHVGGAVAREEAGRIDHALETAKQAERDLELDYEAWRMLTETLREAETAEGRHLGEVLGEPVHDRFAALTEGRYGALSLGRDLQAQGLEVAGDLRDVTRLSEGVQEQLATILRLAIAEQLGTALVLDDHLVQTDPSRVAWFREVLREVSDRVQVVVLTCRPEDYTSADERPAPGDASRQTDGMLAVDLTQVIRRA